MEEDSRSIHTDHPSDTFSANVQTQIEWNANPANNHRKTIKSIVGEEGSSHLPSAEMLSGRLIAQKYIQQLRQKDEKIRSLEEENKKLRSTLIAKTAESQCRVDELVKELERHAELVAQLQNELERGMATTMLAHNNKKSRKLPLPPSSSSSMPPNATFPTTSSSMCSSLLSQQPNKQHSAHQKVTAATRKSNSDADEICAKLQSFVAKNNNQQQVAMGPAAAGNVENGECDDALMAEQLVNLMAENPSLLPALLLTTSAATANEQIDGGSEPTMGNYLEPDGGSSILMSMFLDSMAMLEAGNDAGTGGGGKASLMMEEEQQQQGQQNTDFEEVMQRVIGEAMKAGGGGEMPPSHSIPLPLPPIALAGSGTRKAGKGKMAAACPTIPGKFVKSKKPSAAVAGFVTGTAVGPPTISTAASRKEARTSTGGSATISSPVGVRAVASCTPPVPSTPPVVPAAHHHQSSSSSSLSSKQFTSEEQKLANELEMRIDQNILQLGSRPLNTAELAVQCTRMMREYSIGQRLFARTVMCKVSQLPIPLPLPFQSQGSLSELLSKPRPWPKLTDKGRDAFRRIFGWISDDVAIELLCQLSPRKVATAEKIVHPDPSTLLEPLADGTKAEIAGSFLAERIAGAMVAGRREPTEHAAPFTALAEQPTPKSIKVEGEFMEQTTGKQPRQHSMPTMVGIMAANVANANSCTGRWRHDDIPREKIIDIYETEKAKLLEQESHLGRTLEGLMGAGSGNGADSASATLTARLDSASPPSSLGIIRPSTGTSKDAAEEQPGAGDSLLFARPNASLNDQREDSTMAPEQEQPSQIAQSKLDAGCIVLDTEEVVRQVKDFLAKKGMSQRHFGEHVLNLSQGSVSDLLARPKAWNLLTQKGREPFIRMHMFLEQSKQEGEDDGTGMDGEQMDGEEEEAAAMEEDGEEEEEAEDGAGQNAEDPELQLRLELPLDSPRDEEMAVDKLENTSGQQKEEEEERSEMDDHLAAENAGNPKEFLENILAALSGEVAERTEEGGSGQQPQQQQQKRQHRKKPPPSAANSQPKQAKTANNSSQASGRPMAIKQEMPTEDVMDKLDTASVARRIKECLSKSNISQRAFGQHVLNITSGCVSDLLTKPKPWVMLGWKQQNCYMKMRQFLDDPGAVERLRSDEQHRCEVNNALNALKAISAVGSGTNKAIGCGGANNNCTSSALLGLVGIIDQQQRQHSPAAIAGANGIDSARAACSSTLQIVTDLANELGANTPIGTILKKANSPKPTVPLGSAALDAVGQQKQQQQLNGTSPAGNNKRKATPSSAAVANEAASIGPTVTGVVVDDLAGPPKKKTPRFQRTPITEKQREAMMYIFAHEQRPNARCVEQLAAKLGLTPRTVTNWFHNYRTRQKAKEIKVDDFGQPLSNAASTQTPAQVLIRALNATDSKTTKWFKELAELLNRHSDAPPIDIEGIGAGRGSVGTASAESSPPSSLQHAASANSNVEEQEELLDYEFEEAESTGSKGRAESCGTASSVSISSPQNVSSIAGGSQLDRVIARLMAGKAQ